MTDTATNRRVTRSTTRGAAAPVANPPRGSRSRGGPASLRDATAGAHQNPQVLQELQDRQVIFVRNRNAQAFAEDLSERMARMEECVAAQSAAIESLQAHNENLQAQNENLEAEIGNLQTVVKPTIGRKGKRLLRR